MLTVVDYKHDLHYDETSATLPGAVAPTMVDGRRHILLAASGSVATIKLPQIVAALGRHESVSMRIIVSSRAADFLAGQSTEQPTLSGLFAMPGVEAVYTDAHEWAQPWKRGEPILHIELRRWADMLVVAPLSAHTMAKIVNGMADNLLTSVVRAWDTDGAVDGGGKVGRKRILVAPAMNTAMWRHPVTAKHLAVLEGEWGVKDAAGTGTKAESTNGDDGIEGDREDVQGGWFEVLRPQVKALACGDVGDGAMAPWEKIVEVIEERMEL